MILLALFFPLAVDSSRSTLSLSLWFALVRKSSLSLCLSSVLLSSFFRSPVCVCVCVCAGVFLVRALRSPLASQSVFLLIQELVRPYESARDNRLESLTLLSLITISILAAAQTTGAFLVRLSCAFFVHFPPFPLVPPRSEHCVCVGGVDRPQLITTVIILVVMSVVLLLPVARRVTRRLLAFCCRDRCGGTKHGSRGGRAGGGRREGDLYMEMASGVLWGGRNPPPLGAQSAHEDGHRPGDPSSTELQEPLLMEQSSTAWRAAA